jgi:hypothetical protein
MVGDADSTGITLHPDPFIVLGVFKFGRDIHMVISSIKKYLS